MSAQEKVNILMIDDQPGKLLTYEAILEELGENLIKASSGREALEHLLKNDIAVVLMDVSMPELDGFELAEMIRQHPRHQGTAIIFISAIHLTDIDQLQGYKRGAVDYISVPVNPELLRAKVSVFAEIHRKTRQLEMLNNELRDLSRRLIAAQDEERRRIARELHDGLGQDLAAIQMNIDKIFQMGVLKEANNPAVADVTLLVGRAVQQVRSISYLLHPPLLDEVGLLAAIRWYSDGLTKRSGIDTSVEVQPSDFPRLPSGMETAIFRIVQEALTNVFRHSGARKAKVSLVKEEDSIIVMVCDDGKGISDHTAAFRPQNIGIGIGGMRQRIKEFGGEIRLRNAEPGTMVEAIIPVQFARDAIGSESVAARP